MIKRERYLERIRPFIDTELIKVITGIRRSGKSVMLELIKDELRANGVNDSQFIYFNFESLSNEKYSEASILYAELKNRISEIRGKSYLFFDEIQEVVNWERCINSCRVDFDCDIYITGSNAKLLSGELATYLGGRYVEFVIYPFSFEEYLDSRKAVSSNANIINEFMNYVNTGGMPFLTNLADNKEASLQYLRDIYSSIVLKNIVKRNNIRDIDFLERIISYVIVNIGQTFSARSISNYFKNENRKVALDTVLNYLKICCDAYLFCKLSREDVVGKKVLSVNEKYYVIDQGIREAIYGNNEKDINQILENIVCMELIRRGYVVTVGKIADKEIDFIGEKNGEKIYVQVTYLLASSETINREFVVYNNINDNYPKFVLSMDNFDMSRNGIKHHNICDFLLMSNWN